MHMFRQCCVQHANGCRTMFCHTVQYLDSVVSNSPMVGLCCVQLSDGLWAECPTVQWSDCAFSNCPMVGQSCVQLSKGRIMLCQTVQWLDSVVSNSPMVSQCYYNYKKRSPRRRARYLNSKMDDYIVLNCLVGCINIFFDNFLTLSKFCEILRVSSDRLIFKILLYWTVSNFLYSWLPLAVWAGWVWSLITFTMVARSPTPWGVLHQNLGAEQERGPGPAPGLYAALRSLPSSQNLLIS